jgi:EAL domain-containing protein (putative c-di-GMP-specific phosphodiesterase class I)
MVKDAAPADGAGLAAELARALEQHEFFLVYQPAIDLQSGAFAGVEALIRWRHPTRGVLGPDRFLEELEASDQVSAVGRWTLSTACRQGALWHRKGYRFSVSVNVAARQFAGAHFAGDVADALGDSRFNPEQLVLEFSQRTLLDDADAGARLAAPVALGVKVSVDDFDLEHSALEDLAALPVSIVKLSRVSVSSIVASKKGASKVHELVAHARTRDVSVIASGVEDAAQRELLASQRVDQGQGFLFSRPYEVAEIDRFLEDFALFSGKPL